MKRDHEKPGFLIIHANPPLCVRLAGAHPGGGLSGRVPGLDSFHYDFNQENYLAARGGASDGIIFNCKAAGFSEAIEKYPEPANCLVSSSSLRVPVRDGRKNFNVSERVAAICFDTEFFCAIVSGKKHDREIR
ncbi:MAG: hypothetical protein BWY31_04305 [Lentisphaerae bacterium ADurb.Bin242]|nr:MAG: hypothetical protein BWY31_04305 [Lentisphaerae bacterium ADurb.Bin242]